MANKETQFQPGNTFGKGRPKGSKNRTTEQIRDFLKDVFDANMDTMQEDLDKMNPFMRRKTLNDLMKYWTPALSKNDNTNTSSGQVTIRVEYQDDQMGVLPASPVLNNLGIQEANLLEIKPDKEGL